MIRDGMYNAARNSFNELLKLVLNAKKPDEIIDLVQAGMAHVLKYFVIVHDGQGFKYYHKFRNINYTENDNDIKLTLLTKTTMEILSFIDLHERK
jgi:hypothetical protein